MEQRLKQYHEEALKGRTNKSMKNMNGLRKFIHKNQNYDFTDRDKTRLFSVVECYFTMFDRSKKDEKSTTQQQDKDEEPVTSFPLIEDCLKVPFFTGKQKSTMLKWYYEMQNDSSPSSSSSSTSASSTSKPPAKKYYDDDGEDDYDENYDDEQ
eukprot:TRINITY_DN7334_c0_g1_i1.p1 TRINITY_DN7334_c0_g1~~TRINITY_DN7334_c0_g1_i1.p1  ORF type:complete len:160 (-),score=53.41 TRINITY_DN7334_c0_g1_i1:14-472(-)